MYSEDIIKTDFPHRQSGYDNTLLMEVINKFYDKVKTIPLDSIKTLLPIDHIGYNGTYISSCMIRPHNANKYFPFSMIGEIYDWYGDKTSTSIIKAVGNSEEEVFRRLLILYIGYLRISSPNEYAKIAEQIDKRRE